MTGRPGSKDHAIAFAMGHDHGAREQASRDRGAVAAALVDEGLPVAQILRVVRMIEQKELMYG